MEKDKPYSERTGGSYVRDPQSGKLTQSVKPPERPEAQPRQPAVVAQPAAPAAEAMSGADAGKSRKDK